jgi:hypothetical protein
MATTAAKTTKMEAREACVVVVGARPIEYAKRIVRDRHTGKLVEIDLHEAPPVDEGDPGRSYAFAKGERVWPDHEAIAACPSLFRPAED